MNRRAALLSLGALPLATTVEAQADIGPKTPKTIDDPEGLLDASGIEWAHCCVNLARISAPGQSFVLNVFTLVQDTRRLVVAELECSDPKWSRLVGSAFPDDKQKAMAVRRVLSALRFDCLIDAAAATKVKVGNSLIWLARDEFVHPRRTVQTLERNVR